MSFAGGTERHWAANLCSPLSVHVLRLKSLLEELHGDNPSSVFLLFTIFLYDYQIREKFLLRLYWHAFIVSSVYGADAVFLILYSASLISRCAACDVEFSGSLEDMQAVGQRCEFA